MSTRIETLNPETTTGKSKELFNAVQDKLGFIPNLIKVFGNSPATLQTYLSLGELTGSGNFSNKFREQLALAIAEENTCNYCLSAHTAIGKMNGFNDDQILEIRSGQASWDEKLDALAKFVKSASENRSKPSEETTEALFEAGFNKANLVDIILMIGDKTISNYLHGTTQIPVDFPAALELEYAS